MKKFVFSLFIALGAATPTLADQAVTQFDQVARAEQVYGIWIDVRTPEEFAEGHIEGAVNIPFEQISHRISEVTTDKNASINLYCRSGRRSAIALNTLKEMGFVNLTNQGSYQDLVAKGRK